MIIYRVFLEPSIFTSSRYSLLLWKPRSITANNKLDSDLTPGHFDHDLVLETAWSRVLLEKSIVSQLVRKFPAFYVT
jgi:hypothetical protein